MFEEKMNTIPENTDISVEEQKLITVDENPIVSDAERDDYHVDSNTEEEDFSTDLAEQPELFQKDSNQNAIEAESSDFTAPDNDTHEERDLADIMFSGAVDNEAIETKEKKSCKVKKPVRITGIIIGIFVLIYAVGCIFYHFHFFNRSKINDVNVSNCSVASVVQHLKDEESNFVLSLKKRDGSTSVLQGKDFDCKFNDTGTIQQTLDNQSCWNWPVCLFSDIFYYADLNYQYDDTKLQAAIDALAINSGENIEPAVNAHPIYNNGTVEIVKEVYGNTVNQEKLNAAIREAIQKGQTELDLTQVGAYETPKYLSDAPEVEAAKTAMEKAVCSVLTYTIDSDQEVLNVGTFGSWLICDENMTLTVDQEKGAAYLSALGDKYDTAGGEYNFTTSGGSQIVISGGTFGWAIDEKAELPLMTADILSGEMIARPITSKGAASRTGAKDVGNTYVEISLSAQTMWLYVNGSCIVSTPVVTGGPGHRTPSGVFRIESHSRNATLTGSNDDGSTYASFVRYWMPFYYGDGIHDASWRGSFGGDIYITGGSHGCVNTPLDAVATIYENTSDGCPVVIY